MKIIIKISVILLLVVLYFNISFAESDYRYFFDNDTVCDCSIPGAYLIGSSPNHLSVTCTYFNEKELYEKDAVVRKLSSGITFWDKIDSTEKTFQLHKEQKYSSLVSKCEKDKDCIIVEDILESSGWSFITRKAKPKEAYRQKGKTHILYNVNKEMIYDDYALISVGGEWRVLGEEPKDSFVIGMVNSMIDCQKSNIDNSINDGSGKVSFKLFVENKPMKYVMIYNKDDVDNVDKWTTTNENGEVSFSVSDKNNFDFVVELKYRKDNFDYFRLIGDDRQEALKLLFHVEDDRVVTITIDNGDFKLPVHDIDANVGDVIYLDKYLSVENGLISPLINYIHFSEVLEFYKDELKVDLKKRTLDILLYSSGSASYNYENDRSWILMNGDYSKYENEYRPFVAYHEFSHYVQHMLYGKTFEESLSLFNINHGGYANPTTSDSFSEGFAAFMPVIIANYYDRYWTNDSNEKMVSLYPLSGSLDENWNAWDRQGKVEEYAIAGILWDLVDGKAESDAEFKLMEIKLRKVLKEVISETDMNNDGSWSKQELFYSFMMQNINLDLNDYLDSVELEILNDSDLITYMDENGKFDSDRRILTSDFWDYMVLNWKIIEEDWKKDMPEMYEKTPQKITLDDLISKLSSVSDDDGIDLTFNQLWSVLKEPQTDFSSVYDSLIKVADKSLIDEIFVSHGFFMETSVGNGEYENGEPFQDLNKDGKWNGDDELYVDLGVMNYDLGEKIGIASNYNRKLRRSFEPLEGEYVKVNPEVPFYDLKYIIYGVDYYGLKLPSQIYTIRASNDDGMIYVPMQKDARVEISVWGVETTNHLVVSSAFFEDNYVEAIERGYFVEHEFEYAGDLPVYVEPFAVSEGGFSWLLVVLLVLLVVVVVVLKNNGEGFGGKKESRKSGRKKK